MKCNKKHKRFLSLFFKLKIQKRKKKKEEKQYNKKRKEEF